MPPDLTDDERAALPLAAFGWPEARAYPADTEARFQVAVETLAAAPDAEQPAIQARLAAIARRHGWSCPESWPDPDPDSKAWGPLERKRLDPGAAGLTILGGDDPAGSQYGLIRGHAAVFKSWDRVREWIEPGAFAPHLGSFLRDGFMTSDHDWSKSLGTPVSAAEDSHGLAVVGEFHSTPEAQAARTVAAERLARGKSVSLSIGYQVKRDAYTPEGRKLFDLPLFEWSLVTVPAHPAALVTGVKTAPPGGLSFGAEATAARDAVVAFVARAEALAALRASDGRPLGVQAKAALQELAPLIHSHRDALAALAATVATLAPDSPPPPAGPTPIQAAYLRYLATQARALGVPLT